MIRMTLALTMMLGLMMGFWTPKGGNALETSRPHLAAHAPVAMQQTQLASVNGRKVNLRAGPSRYYEIYYTLPRGALVEVLPSDAENWMRLRDLATGQVGYMSADFVSIH